LNSDDFLPAIMFIISSLGGGGTLLVEALRYKPEGRGFDSRWGHFYFSLTYSFQPHYGLGVDSASNRNKYQEFWELKAAGIEILGASTSWSRGLYRDFLLYLSSLDVVCHFLCD
jgi:hypothetical protein